jgi:MoaA/NifB/PqqE/SkfB family radical SAM enzyme
LPSERSPLDAEPTTLGARRLVGLALSTAASALASRRFLYCLWEITHRCNARCGMCALWRRPARAADELPVGDIAAILDRLRAHGCRALNLSGGEPTLRADLEQIVAASSRRGFWTSMVTNGSGLTRARVRALRQAGLDSLLVSVDAAHAEVHDRRRGLPGCHAQALRALQWIRDEFLWGHRSGGMMVVLSGENVGDLGCLVDLAEGLGVSMAVQPYHPKKTCSSGAIPSLPPEALATLRAASRQGRRMLSSRRYLASLADPARAAATPCRAGRKYLALDPYGGLHACVDLPACGYALRDDFAVLRSAETQRAVRACLGCWYSFRGETDLALRPRGYLDKLRLALAICKGRPRCLASPALHPCVPEPTPNLSQAGDPTCEET